MNKNAVDNCRAILNKISPRTTIYDYEFDDMLWKTFKSSKTAKSDIKNLLRQNGINVIDTGNNSNPYTTANANQMNQLLNEAVNADTVTSRTSDTNNDYDYKLQHLGVTADEITNMHVMSKQEFRTYLPLAKAGDSAAIRYIYVNNIKLIIWRVTKFAYRVRKLVTEDDLFQAGSMGLIHAIEKFDDSQDVEFSTYAIHWIDQGIRRELETANDVVSIPVNFMSTMYKVKYTQDALTETLGRQPSIHELTEYINQNKLFKNYYKYDTFTTSQISHYVRTYNTFANVLSVDATITSDSSLEYIDTIISPDGSPEEITMHKVADDEVRKIMYQALNPREVYIISARYGIAPFQREHTLSEIGDALHITRERVRQIESKAIRKLQSPKYRTSLRELR